MNQGFSPVLAHLLVAGLARRALLSAASYRDLPASHDRLHRSLPVGSQFSASAETWASYPSDAFDSGIAAFLSRNAKTLSAAETA